MFALCGGERIAPAALVSIIDRLSAAHSETPKTPHADRVFVAVMTALDRRLGLSAVGADSVLTEVMMRMRRADHDHHQRRSR